MCVPKKPKQQKIPATPPPPAPAQASATDAPKLPGQSDLNALKSKGASSLRIPLKKGVTTNKAGINIPRK